MQRPGKLTDLIRRIYNLATAKYQTRELLNKLTRLRVSSVYSMFLPYPGTNGSNNVQTCTVTNDE